MATKIRKTLFNLMALLLVSILSMSLVQAFNLEMVNVSIDENNATFEIASEKPLDNINITITSDAGYYAGVESTEYVSLFNLDQGYYMVNVTANSTDGNISNLVDYFLIEKLVKLDNVDPEEIYFNYTFVENTSIDSIEIKLVNSSGDSFGVKDTLEGTFDYLGAGDYYLNVNVTSAKGTVQNLVFMITLLPFASEVDTVKFDKTNFEFIVENNYLCQDSNIEVFNASGDLVFSGNEDSCTNFNAVLNPGNYTFNYNATSVVGTVVSQSDEFKAYPPVILKNDSGVIQIELSSEYWTYLDDLLPVEINLYKDDILDSAVDGVDWVEWVVDDLADYDIACVVTTATGLKIKGLNQVIRPDTIAPEFGVMPNNNVNYGDVLSLQFEATDNLGSLITWNISSVNFSINENGTISNLSSLAIGLYTFNVSAKDNLGNTNVTSFVLNVSDLGAPEFAFIPANVSITVGSNFNVDFDATDNVLVDSWSVNNANFSIDVNGTLTNNISLPIGQYDMNVSVNDTAGNTNNVAFQVIVNAAPVVVEEDTGTGGNTGGIRVPNWECDEWSACLDGEQTRVCTDTRNLGSVFRKPIEVQSCTVEIIEAEEDDTEEESGQGSTNESLANNPETNSNSNQTSATAPVNQTGNNTVGLGGFITANVPSIAGSIIVLLLIGGATWFAVSKKKKK